MTSEDRSQTQSDDQWLSAAEVYHLATATMPDGQARVTICARANSGLLRTRADRFEKHKEVFEDTELPKEFWWATGHEALHQNWVTGDFETWIKQTYLWRAFGVRFHKADLRKMLPDATPPAGPPVEWIGSGEALAGLERASGSSIEAAQLLVNAAKDGDLRAIAATYQLSQDGGAKRASGQPRRRPCQSSNRRGDCVEGAGEEAIHLA